MLAELKEVADKLRAAARQSGPTSAELSSLAVVNKKLKIELVIKEIPSFYVCHPPQLWSIWPINFDRELSNQQEYLLKIIGWKKEDLPQKINPDDLLPENSEFINIFQPRTTARDELESCVKDLSELSDRMHEKARSDVEFMHFPPYPFLHESTAQGFLDEMSGILSRIKAVGTAFKEDIHKKEKKSLVISDVANAVEEMLEKAAHMDHVEFENFSRHPRVRELSVIVNSQSAEDLRHAETMELLQAFRCPFAFFDLKDPEMAEKYSAPAKAVDTTTTPRIPVVKGRGVLPTRTRKFPPPRLAAMNL